jgi:ribonuclease-3
LTKTDYTGLEERLGYAFKDKQLLKTALTHSSYKNECMLEGIECYERLEFLGDAVLELIVSEYLYSGMPDKREGMLSSTRAQLVCEQSLSQIAKRLKIPDYLILGKGEEFHGGRDKSSILCDVFESILGAIYLEGGYEEAVVFVHSNLLNNTEALHVRNYKSELQQLLWAHDGNVPIEYKVLEEIGPDHSKIFKVGVYIKGELKGTGTGKSKKEAQQHAAAAALEN